MLPFAPLTPQDALRVQALAQRVGRQPAADVWAQGQLLLTPDGQEVLALLMDKLRVQPLPANLLLNERAAKIRLAAVYHRWLTTLH